MALAAYNPVKTSLIANPILNGYVYTPPVKCINPDSA